MTMVSSAEARSATAPISGLAECSGLEFVARLADGSIRRPPMVASSWTSVGVLAAAWSERSRLVLARSPGTCP